MPDPALPSDSAIPDGPLEKITVLGLDLETTGLSAWRGDQVCEVGIVRGSIGRIDDVMSTYVDPGRPIPAVVQTLTGIRDADVRGAAGFNEILGAILLAIGRQPLVIHNAPFDLAFLHQACMATNRPVPSNLTIDTLLIARFLSEGRLPSSLGSVSDRLGIARERAHRASDDARAAVRVFFAQLPELRARGITRLSDLIRHRLAASAAEVAAAPSSVLLDMLTRAIRMHGEVEMIYSTPPGRATYRVQPVELVADRELVATIISEGHAQRAGTRRTFRAVDILQLEFDGKTFWSPWLQAAGDAPDTASDTASEGRTE